MLKSLTRYKLFFSLLIIFALLWVASAIRYHHSCNDLVEFESYKTCILHMGMDAARKKNYELALAMAKAVALFDPNESNITSYQCKWSSELTHDAQAIDYCLQALNANNKEATEEFNAYYKLTENIRALKANKLSIKNGEYHAQLRKSIFE